MTGRTLNHYLLLEEVRGGGMGEVWLAEDTRLGRKVALKVLPPEFAADPLRRKRFERESKLLAALNHPNIVTIHAVEECEGRPFLVMEWIEGRPLEEMIPFEGLPLRSCLEIAIPMVGAVAEAHRAGIVHRDLKPANIMVRTDGMVKVVDFGISKMEEVTLLDGPFPGRGDLNTAEGLVVGTLHYMSPQQLEGHQVDARSDIFSLGVMLYEMATGRRPFQGASSASVVSAILRDAPRPALEIKPSLPAAIEPILRRCLAKDPAQRYQSAQELHDVLAGLLLGATATAPLAEPLGSATAEEPIHARAGRRRGLVVAAAVLAAALLLAGGAWLRSQWAAPPEAAVPAAAANVAVAVLPLRNLSGDPEQEYFSEGTTEAVIAGLAKIGGLRVTSRNSVMRYKGIQKPLPEIARELGVGYIVEGSVMRSGDEVMIVVQLVDPKTDGALWGDNYHGKLSDIFTLQQNVAEAVARETKVEITSADRTRLARVQEVDTEVYEMYLKGRFHQNKRTPEALLTALDYFEKALDLDPRYALAWAAKADCYASLGSFGYAVMPPLEAIPKAKEAAERAIELDDSLSEAHTALGLATMQGWEWPQAERELDRALELNPSNADAFHRYTIYLTAMGRHGEAVAAALKAQQLDPLSPIIGQGVATAHFFAGNYEEAIRRCEEKLQKEPFWLTHLLLGQSYSQAGDHAAADGHFRKALDLTQGNPFVLGAMGRNHARWGRTAEARKVLEQLLERSRAGYLAPTLAAKLHFALGEPDQGFTWLYKALAERDQSLGFLAVDPDYATVRSDPRFARLLEQVGLRRA